MIKKSYTLKAILMLSVLGYLFYSVREEKPSNPDLWHEESITLHQKIFTEGYYIHITSDEKNTAQIEYAFQEQPNAIKCRNLDDYDAIWNSVSYVAMKDYYLMLFRTAHQRDTCVYLPRNRNLNPLVFRHVYAIDTELGKLASYSPEGNRFLIFDLNFGQATDEVYTNDLANQQPLEYAGFKNGRFMTSLGS